jgi:hypothetical protein
MATTNTTTTTARLVQLADHDAQAVDLLLDRSNMAQDGNGGGSGTFVAPVGDAVTKRIGAVETVMRILSEMPDEEMPADLVGKTLKRIQQRESAVGQPVIEQGQHPQSGIGQGPSHA